MYACGQDPCAQNIHCDTCTVASTGCVWCLDSQSCQKTIDRSVCRNYITNVKYCPANPCTPLTSCNSCTTSPGCGWCLDDSACVYQDQEANCTNVINSSTYCPSSLYNKFK